VTVRVTVIDYGIGNLHSVLKAMRAGGAEVQLTESPDKVRGAERLVLPGVGAFADGMAGLRKRSLVEPILEFAKTGRPFLGICLGMQLLLGESEEFGRHEGLGIVPGKVVGIPQAPGLKVPHIGWNRITPRPGATWKDTLLAPVSEGSMVYFVHSFYAVPEAEEHRLADVHYGGHRMSAAVQKNNVVGCQFHPEKSGPDGLAVVGRFLSA
jgi:imidazole glycerol-phosphate synthase subunit HisH